MWGFGVGPSTLRFMLSFVYYAFSALNKNVGGHIFKGDWEEETAVTLWLITQHTV
jgi:hypothetical protein